MEREKRWDFRVEAWELDKTSFEIKITTKRGKVYSKQGKGNVLTSFIRLLNVAFIDQPENEHLYDKELIYERRK